MMTSPHRRLFGDRLDQVGDADRKLLQPEQACVHTRSVQQVIDEFSQPVRGTIDGLDIVPGFFRTEPVKIVEYHGGVAFYRSQRRTQLMRDGGKEVALQLIQYFVFDDLSLEVFSLADIHEVAQYRFPSLELDGGNRLHDPLDLPGLVENAVFAGIRIGFLQGINGARPDDVTILNGDKVLQLHAE